MLFRISDQISVGCDFVFDVDLSFCVSIEEKLTCSCHGSTSYELLSELGYMDIFKTRKHDIFKKNLSVDQHSFQPIIDT